VPHRRCIVNPRREQAQPTSPPYGGARGPVYPSNRPEAAAPPSHPKDQHRVE
jgi:hypothetical protein